MSDHYLLVCPWPGLEDQASMLIAGHRPDDDDYTYRIKIGRVGCRAPSARIIPIGQAGFIRPPTFEVNGILNEAFSGVGFYRYESEWLWTGGVSLDPRIDFPLEPELAEFLTYENHRGPMIVQIAKACSLAIGVHVSTFISHLKKEFPGLKPNYQLRLQRLLGWDYGRLMAQPMILDDTCMALLERLDELLKEQSDRAYALAIDLNIGTLALSIAPLIHELQSDLAVACAVIFQHPGLKPTRNLDWHLQLDPELLCDLARVPLRSVTPGALFERGFAASMIVRYRDEREALQGKQNGAS